MILIPNLLTFLNLCFGLSAIFFSLSGDWGTACQILLFSIFFDIADGWTARRLDRVTRFGAFFDSAANFVSFGLAPAFIFYSYESRHSAFVLAALIFYTGSSAFRLIRFHIQKPFMRPGTFQGLPTTASAAIFVAGFWIAPSVFYFWLLSLLMISRVQVSKPSLHKNIRVPAES